jgi:hypothetical protein
MTTNFMTAEDLQLLLRLEAVAKEKFDGHFTIMRFTTNWRVGFHQPVDRDQTERMPEGATFREAAIRALETV